MKLIDFIIESSVQLALKTEHTIKEGPLPHHPVKENANSMGKLRIKYQERFVVRSVILFLLIGCYFFYPKFFEPAEGFALFEKLVPLHLLWLYWMIGTILPSFATRGMISIGALKYTQKLYIPGGKIQSARLFAYIKRSTKDTLKIFLVWVVYMLCLTVGHFLGILRTNEMILICAVLNVLDTIFVLYWCPLRAWFMKNRCCTTCRIFNWDHILIYSALLFVPGVFGYSLVLFSLMEFVVWEVCFFLHPERFWEGSNVSLRCSNCVDKMCMHSKRHSQQKEKQTV